MHAASNSDCGLKYVEGQRKGVQCTAVFGVPWTSPACFRFMLKRKGESRTGMKRIVATSYDPHLANPNVPQAVLRHKNPNHALSHREHIWEKCSLHQLPIELVSLFQGILTASFQRQPKQGKPSTGLLFETEIAKNLWQMPAASSYFRLEHCLRHTSDGKPWGATASERWNLETSLAMLCNTSGIPFMTVANPLCEVATICRDQVCLD